jgi:NADH/F420H2 dehydrogenase subunit C
MTAEELKTRLSSLHPELEFPEIASRFLNVQCKASDLVKIAESIKADAELKLDFLFSLTALDWPECLEVIYHLRSSAFEHEIVLRVKTEGRENPEVPTVCAIWPTAEFHEREVFDLFGVRFKGHPDLRRIFLEDDWVGYPLRKDYEDEINMIEL